MDFAQIIILGLVQGVTEFLPISSTAHLILLPWFFKFPDPGLTFDIALHLGTLLAILIYFRREWLEILQESAEVGTKIFSGTNLPSFLKNFVPPRTLSVLFIATIPGIFFGFLFESWAETFFRSPIIIAISLAFFGLLLYIADKKFTHQKTLEDLDFKRVFFIGLGQALAIIPGVSRSGVSMTTGLFVGLKREAAVRFSFLLSAPIILGSVLASLFKMTNSQLLIPNFQFLVGVLTAFLSGILTIKFLLKFVQKRSFMPFVIYRIVLAIIIILVSFI